MTDLATPFGEATAALLDDLPDGVVVAGPDGRVEIVSRPAAALLEVDAAASLGRPLAEVVTLQDHDGRDWCACNDPYGGLTTRTALTEQSWVLRSGAEVLVTARLVRDVPAGPVVRVVVSLRSARGRERLDRERSDLVATVAHELRSPLTGVKGFVSTLLTKWDRLNDEQKKLMLTTVHSDADRLTRLIAELLDVARIDTNRLSLYPRPLEMVAVTERALDTVRATTARVIELDAEPDLPRVFFDPDKLVQVITNLVENAVRHGEGTVTVRLRTAQAAAGPVVRMEVDDEGEGIAPEIRRRAFTKFWQHGARGGSGLGLYIVHGLVSAHGGSVTIDQTPAGGARIVVEWPTDDRRPG